MRIELSNVNPRTDGRIEKKELERYPECFIQSSALSVNWSHAPRRSVRVLEKRDCKLTNTPYPGEASRIQCTDDNPT